MILMICGRLEKLGIQNEKGTETMSVVGDPWQNPTKCQIMVQDGKAKLVPSKVLSCGIRRIM